MKLSRAPMTVFPKKTFCKLAVHICQGRWTYRMYFNKETIRGTVFVFFLQSNAGNYTPRPISVQSRVWNQSSLLFISQKTVVDMQDGVSLYKGPEDLQWNFLWCYDNFRFLWTLILTHAVCCFCTVGPQKAAVKNFFFPFVLAFTTGRKWNPSLSLSKRNTLSFLNTFISLLLSSLISCSLTTALV